MLTRLRVVFLSAFVLPGTPSVSAADRTGESQSVVVTAPGIAADTAPGDEAIAPALLADGDDDEGGDDDGDDGDTMMAALGAPSSLPA
jgi:hypothetical protein